MPKTNTPEPDEAVEAQNPSAGKGRATPSRKEREAANKRPLVPTDRKEANRAAREKERAVREKYRLGMAAGDEKYLPERDKGAQRRYIRDYTDARFSIGEILIPVMFVIIILSTLLPIQLQDLTFVFLLGYMLISILDITLANVFLKRRLRAKFGEDRLQKGNAWYFGMRAMQLRMLRIPKPQAKYGRFPE
ncbi:DUF3043 domain-containing protein [Arenivirga flava]|uniref:DUF3043 domain-containing protein n=1 Tax=Arenivirga flava TaxID=1930060 RepID=UPI0024E0E7AD|nr:DUF3043 domain-containing protein [Arenivirga flava]